MPIQKAIHQMNPFTRSTRWNLAESHLQMIDQMTKTWNSSTPLPLLDWSIKTNAEAVSGKGHYSMHPHIEASYINYVQSNTSNLFTMMEDAVRFKKSGLLGQMLLANLTPLDTVGVQLNCRFFVRRFINILFPDQFTAISHDKHLQNVQTILAYNNLLPVWGNNFLEQSYNTRQAIENYITSNQTTLPNSVATLSSQTLLYIPALAFHIR